MGDTGYYNSSLALGSRVTIVDNPLLPSGTYTLLPARYALLPGAFLVTPSDYSVRGSLVFEDGSAIVSGYSMSGLTSKGQPATYQSYEVLPWDVIRQRSEYVDSPVMPSWVLLPLPMNRSPSASLKMRAKYRFSPPPV